MLHRDEETLEENRTSHHNTPDVTNASHSDDAPESEANNRKTTQPMANGLRAGAPIRPDSPTFRDLGVREETVAALEAVGITRAFAIQEYAIPILLRGADVIGQAPTGTGKTLGFGIPILQRLLGPDEGADGRPQALVVVPTRELGLQVARDLATAGSRRRVRVLPVYGGVAYEPQIKALRAGVDLVVGTPGRLLDLADSGHLQLDAVSMLVLDEADRMLDLGFLDDVEKILAMLPERRQTMLFSATMPDPIVALSRRFLRNPVTIHADHLAATGPSPSTEQYIYRTHNLNRIEVLVRALQAKDRGLAMVFCRTKRTAQRVADELDFRGFAVAAVHGDLGQGARERALRAFRTGKIDILVATDVAARGLDVSGVTHVINYDCPEDAETYVHRIGRTGRAGAAGVAVTFVDWEELPRWRLIDKALGLGVPEPVETYHTSRHLYDDLRIPESASATLPSEQRIRAGLAAEAEEDIEPRRRRRRSRTRGRGKGSAPNTGRPSGQEASSQPGERVRRRRRRRLGSGEGGNASDTTGEASAGTPDPHADIAPASSATDAARPADAVQVMTELASPHASSDTDEARTSGWQTDVELDASNPTRRRRRRRRITPASE